MRIAHICKAGDADTGAGPGLQEHGQREVEVEAQLALGPPAAPGGSGLPEPAASAQREPDLSGTSQGASWLHIPGGLDQPAFSQNGL